MSTIDINFFSEKSILFPELVNQEAFENKPQMQIERRKSLTPDELEKILAKSPYEKDSFLSPPRTLTKKLTHTTPSDIRLAGQIRKRHLEEANTSNSPFKNEKMTEYGKEPLSQRAKKHKIDNDITAGRNVSVVIFFDTMAEKYQYVIANTIGHPGGPHAELRALDALPKHISTENIHLVYTEREPCHKGSNCHCKLKAMLDSTTKVVYSVKGVSEEEFRKLQAEHGIRVAKQVKKTQKV